MEYLKIHLQRLDQILKLCQILGLLIGHPSLQVIILFIYNNLILLVIPTSTTAPTPLMSFPTSSNMPITPTTSQGNPLMFPFSMQNQFPSNNPNESLNSLQSLFQLVNSSMLGGNNRTGSSFEFSPAATPSYPPVTQPIEERYAHQLATLDSMGFTVNFLNWYLLTI